MELETILDAMLLTADADKFLSRSPSRYLRAQRQYLAFRARILRMDAKKDKRIAELEAVIAELCVDCYQIYYDMVEAEELSDD